MPESALGAMSPSLRRPGQQSQPAAKEGSVTMVSGDSGCSSPTRPGYSQPYLADYGSVYHHLPGYPPVQGYVPVPSLPTKVSHGGAEYNPHSYQTTSLYQHTTSPSNPQTSTLTVFYHDYTPR